MTSNTNTSMGGFPTVSIVIPTFNHAQFLHQALASVATQTFQNWEAIMLAGKEKLGNLITIVDRNNIQRYFYSSYLLFMEHINARFNNG